MKITLLGTRGEIIPTAPYHSKKSGILINDNMLLDCGDKRFLQHNPHYLFITHLHPDHAYFVREKNALLPTLSIWAPESYKKIPITVPPPTIPLSIEGYIITPIPTIHSLHVASTAYTVEHEGKKILYTGDMIWIEKKYRHLLNNIDLVITEASFMRLGGRIRRSPEGKIHGHAGIPNLIRLFKPYSNHFVFVHFGYWFYRNVRAARKQFARLAKEYGVSIIVGYDGLTITL